MVNGFMKYKRSTGRCSGNQIAMLLISKKLSKPATSKLWTAFLKKRGGLINLKGTYHPPTSPTKVRRMKVFEPKAHSSIPSFSKSF